jgi:hypothetical protein
MANSRIFSLFLIGGGALQHNSYQRASEAHPAPLPQFEPSGLWPAQAYLDLLECAEGGFGRLDFAKATLIIAT